MNQLIRVGPLMLVGALMLALVTVLGTVPLYSAKAQTATTTSPTISSIEVTEAETAATITWMTDVPATSQVGYGTTSTSSPYDHYSAIDEELSTDHTITLTNLMPDTTYNFVAISGIGTSTGTTTTMGTTTSANQTFTTLPEEMTDLERFLAALERLMAAFPGFSSQIQDFADDLTENGDGDNGDNGNGDGDNGNGDDNGDNGNGTTTPPEGDASIEQDGQTVNAGGSIDFAGRNFGPEELVTITLDGDAIGRTGFTNLAGSFTTGSLSVPSEPGTYTYQFTGQETGRTATAMITVQ